MVSWRRDGRSCVLFLSEAGPRLSEEAGNRVLYRVSSTEAWDRHGQAHLYLKHRCGHGNRGRIPGRPRGAVSLDPPHAVGRRIWRDAFAGGVTATHRMFVSAPQLALNI